MTVIQDALDFLRRWRGLWLILAAVILYTSVVCLIYKAVRLPEIAAKADKQAEEKYNEKFAAYQKAQQDAEDRKKTEDEKEKEERMAVARRIAKVLYFLRFNFNLRKDVITACWCLFNRVDIKTGEYAYLETLDDVINQPGQWIEYSEDNPALDNITMICYEQYCIWLEGEHRPCSPEFVFLVWSASEVYLKDELDEAKHPHKWSYSGA